MDGSLDFIWLCGDVHGNLRTLTRALAQTDRRPQAIILLGDLDPPEPVGPWLRTAVGVDIDTWFIHGNHETDNEPTYRNMFCARGADRNLHGCVQDVAGLHIAGLGGIFRPEVWYPPMPSEFDNYEALHAHLEQLKQRARYAQQSGQPRSESLTGLDNMMRTHHSTIFPEDYDRLADQKADVLIVHEAPSCHPHGFETIDLLAQTMGVRWVAHGHHHDALDYSSHKERLGFATIGVGLRGITTLGGDVIVPGELDAVRARKRHVPAVNMNTKG